MPSAPMRIGYMSSPSASPKLPAKLSPSRNTGTSSEASTTGATIDPA